MESKDDMLENRCNRKTIDYVSVIFKLFKLQDTTFNYNFIEPLVHYK